MTNSTDAFFTINNGETAENKPLLPGQTELRDATMKPTQNVPEGWDLKNPAVMARVAVMPNETHPDLIGAVRNILIGAGVSDAQLASCYDSHFLIASAKNTSLLAQRVALCSYWNYQLCELGNEVYAARQTLALINQTAVAGDILDLFSRQPLDAILKNNLPV